MSVNEMLMAAAGQAGGANEYVEDVFSTYLYTGNGSTQTITNGIDLAGEGGLVWLGKRTTDNINLLTDTVRGNTKYLTSYLTDAEATATTRITSFNSDGFSLGNSGLTNTSANYCSWTFRKAPKFFDVVTGTGAGTFNHSLGVTPGMIMIKLTSGSSDWWTVHRSSNGYFRLNLTNAAASTGTPGIASSGAWVNANSTTFNTSQFVNAGESFVAYLFAHDAGGFGAAGTDNIISCGSFTADGSGNLSVNLGYEPQYILMKRTDSTGNWFVFDVMRGLSYTNLEYLYPNLSSAAATVTDGRLIPTATGFGNVASFGANATYIYMAIRRPMKTPTSGTEVFSVTTGNFTTPKTVTTNFPVDLCYSTRTGAGTRHFNDRLRGGTTTSYRYLATNSTAAESTGTSAGIGFDNNTAIIDNDWVTGADAVWWNFKRATGFFDVVCYTGTGSATTFSHNLGVAPELIIVKRRNAAGDNWAVYTSATQATKWMQLESTGAASTASTIWNDTAPTSSVFSVGSSGTVNASGGTFVSYLFATVAGVSKVGSYTGTGSTQTINCGFSAGARFVLIKRTDDDGGWYIYDTARGIVSGNDPYLLANTSTAQTTNTDYIDPANSGFEISSTAPAAINANGGSFIFLAIA